METNPYVTPKASVSQNKIIDIPEQIAKKIKRGWIAAIISGLMTMGVMLVAINTGVLNSLFDVWTSIDVILIFGLALGIYKKSRIAATTMFLYFLASKIWIIAETGKPGGLVMAMIFLYFYFQAMVGTFQYHNLVKKS